MSRKEEEFLIALAGEVVRGFAEGATIRVLEWLESTSTGRRQYHYPYRVRYVGV